MAVLLLQAAVTKAQVPDEQLRAEELLSSPLLIDQAWGAYWAGRLHRDSLNDLLIARLSEAQSYLESGAGSVEHAYVLALFDALIESGRTVPARVLIPFKESFRDEILILLARDQGDESLLLEMREQKLNQAQWLAVNNLLLRMRSAHLFVETVKELRITHKFVVVDPNVGESGGGSGGGGVGDGIRFLPKGFPPIGLYQLIAFPSPGYVLVTEGPRNVYYRRTVVPTDRQVGWGVPFSISDGEQERLEYLAAFNRIGVEQATQTFRPIAMISVKSPDDFSRVVDADLQAQVAGIQSFLSVAKQNGLGGLAGVELTIIPEIEDQRRNPTAQLPSVAPEKFTVD